MLLVKLKISEKTPFKKQYFKERKGVLSCKTEILVLALHLLVRHHAALSAGPL